MYLAHTLPQTHPVHKGILEFKKALEFYIIKKKC